MLRRRTTTGRRRPGVTLDALRFSHHKGHQNTGGRWRAVRVIYTCEGARRRVERKVKVDFGRFLFVPTRWTRCITAGGRHLAEFRRRWTRSLNPPPLIFNCYFSLFWLLFSHSESLQRPERHSRPARMMDEMSVTMCYDAHSMEQMSEEEILACLVAETGPTFTVPTKKAKIKESRLQLMEDKEDPLDKFLKENRRLQQASHRLEQENDNLAQKLISSKVALRDALDKAEDRVDELSKELLQARHRVQATEEEKRGKEEEAAMLKEVLRRELEKAEQEVKRSTGIISDYKQICSQLTERLERQQAAHAEELEALKGSMRLCSQCQLVADPDEATADTEDSTSECNRAMESSHSERVQEKAPRQSSERENESLRAQIRELEQELAQTKLQMVEAKCKIQELEHQKGILASDLQQAKNNWISKAFTSLRTSAGAGGGGLHGVGLPAHGGTLSGWSVKKLSWPHKESKENV